MFRINLLNNFYFTTEFSNLVKSKFLTHGGAGAKAPELPPLSEAAPAKRTFAGASLTVMKKIFFYSIFLFHYCTLTPPPITLTQTPTAAERQMLGDGKDIEKDGWILSSVRSSAAGSEVWEKEILDKELYSKLPKDEVFARYRALAYLSGEVRIYKKKGFLGESLSGKLAINPLWKESPYKDEFVQVQSRLGDLVQQTNQNREWIYTQKLKLLNEKNLKPNELEKEKNRIVLSYYNLTELGEYLEVKPNVWRRKE